MIFDPLIAISPVYGLPALFAPALARLIVSRLSSGPPQANEYCRKLRVWRVSFVWYMLALGLPVVLSFLVAVLGRFFGGDPVPQLAPITPLSIFVFILVVGEEPGCRGYAQPQLERHYSTFLAAMILGVLWGCWHLPHYVIPLPSFVICTTALSVIAARRRKHTQGSVLIATLLHGATNTFGFLTPNLDNPARWWLLARVYAVTLLIAII